MKVLGMVGGIAPGSTVDYYTQLLAMYRERVTDGSYPRIVINSVDLTHMMAVIERGDVAAIVDYLSGEIERLVAAGVDFALLASNTPHLVFDELAARSPVKLLSIVEATADAAEAAGAKRVGLLGSRFTMQGRFYPDTFAKRNIEVVAPSDEDLSYVHDRYMAELAVGNFRAETRSGILAVIDRLIADAEVDGVLLAGTDLPPLLRGTQTPVPLFDTTSIHVAAAINEMIPTQSR